MSSKIVKLSTSDKYKLAEMHGMGPVETHIFALKESSIARIIKPPKKFTVKYAGEFIEDIEYIYKSKIQKTHVIVDLTNTREVDLIGQILIYKYLSYTSTNNINLRGFYAENTDEGFRSQFVETGFSDFIEQMFSNPRKANDKFKSIIKNKLFLYPQIIKRKDIQQKITAESELLDLVKKFYEANNSKKTVNVVSRSISEIVSNFFEHAKEDSETMISAKGTPFHFKMVIVDNAHGIVNTLKPLYPNIDGSIILKKSIEKGVSSKKDRLHMGYGLYLISQLCIKNNGQLDIWANGFHLYNKGEKFISEPSGYWQGTLVSVVLNLNNPIPIEDFTEYKNFQNSLNLKFG